MTEQEPTVEFTSVPDNEVENTPHTISATGNTGIEDSTEDFQIRAKFFFFLDGELFAEEELDGLLQDEIVTSTVEKAFNVGDHSLRVEFKIDLYNVDGFDKNTGSLEGGFDAEDSDTASITIIQETFTSDEPDPRQTDGINNAFEGFIEFEIDSITRTETGPIPDDPIQFEYPNPAISIDTGGNFVTHEIIGGATVRQRIGDQPLEISVDGIVTERTAKKLDLLRNARNVVLLSDRFSQNSVTVHVVSISTNPMDDGGAADLSSGEFLYQFSLECVEILDSGDESLQFQGTIPSQLEQQ